MPTSESEKAARLERIRSIVNEDFERIAATEDPFIILNLEPGTTWDEAASRYERYERFYRAENFQRLGDMDLTRKALDIRRAVGRAIVDVQSTLEEQASTDERKNGVGLPEVDPNSAALGEIYFKDGLTYLKLGDLEMACECFRRACDYDPSQGLPLGYLSYTNFRRRMNEPEVVDETRKSLTQAARMDPRNADVFVLIARFHMKLNEKADARDAIEKVEAIAPDHPKLDRLYERLERL
jgi:tetratricopeptide (TPR) repeat protein